VISNIFSLVYDKNCEQPVYPADAITVSHHGDGSPTGNGTGDRLIQVTSQIHSPLIKSSNIFTDVYLPGEDDDVGTNGQRLAYVTYCLRVSLMTPTASAMEVNFIEMLIDLTADLTSEHVTDINVVAPEVGLETIVQNYV
jgi:hypothetical protein